MEFHKNNSNSSNNNSSKASVELHLPPGFRFHPTDEELVVHYLARRAACRPFAVPIIAEVDLYKSDPWELPDKALFGEKEWYFFSPRDRKYPNGSRPNRAAGSGYWKATGTDKPILSQGIKAGVKKALVFYKGRAPKGIKTNWIMHEYRLAENNNCGNKPTSLRRKGTLRLDDWVLCRIYKKNVTVTPSSHKVQQQLQQNQAAVSGVNVKGKLDADDESCLEEVLASLPDIDDSRMCLPRLGSLTAMLSAEQGNSQVSNWPQAQQQQQQHRAGSESGSRSLNDPVVDNCLLDTRYNNLPSLRQQHEYNSTQLEMKPSIFNGFNTGNGDSDEVQSSCKSDMNFMDQGSFFQKLNYHHHQQQQQQRMNHFTGLNGYFFQNSSRLSS